MPGFDFVDLDNRTREYMGEELDLDIRSGTLYYGKRLTAKGVSEYPRMLRSAIVDGDETTLATDLAQQGILATLEMSRSGKGKVYEKSVPTNANEVLAEGEFNRFYLRGLSLRAVEDGIDNLIVYRAKEVDVARSASKALIGKSVHPSALLDDLRANPGVDTSLGLPTGPNSGLSARLP